VRPGRFLSVVDGDAAGPRQERQIGDPADDDRIVDGKLGVTTDR
jgi:hypothetical protein